MEVNKNGESLATVTHTHTHTHLKFKESNRIIKAQYICVYLRYEDGLHHVVCLFCVLDTS